MLKKPKKILFSGGHISPLIAVSSFLEGKADMVVVGRNYTFENDKTESFEKKYFEKKGVSFIPLDAARLQRKFSKKTIPSLLKILPSYKKALSILSQEKPDVVMTFGGYISVPIGLAAYTKKIPLVIHEQTTGAGVANRILGKIATKILISFSSSENYFKKKKTILTGNPIRPEVFTVKKEIHFPEKLPLIYITGGSAGAHAINTLIKEILPELVAHYNIIHQTGDAQEFLDFDKLTALRNSLDRNLQRRYQVRKFIDSDEIGWVYKHAEIVISRAGANTVQELIALNKKAILIPLPYGQKSEQLENAKQYKKTGLGTYIEQNEVQAKTLLDLMNEEEKKKITEVALDKNTAAQNISEILLGM